MTRPRHPGLWALVLLLAACGGAKPVTTAPPPEEGGAGVVNDKRADIMRLFMEGTQARLSGQPAKAVAAFEQHIATAVADVTGVIRVTCPEPIVLRITQSPLLERFNARYPKLQVHFVMSDKYIDLVKGEADVAFRSGDTDDGALVGRKIGDSIWAVYASRTYIERHGAPQRLQDLSHHALVGFDDTMAKHRIAAWLRKVAPDAVLAARSSSVLGLVYSTKAGIGVAPLPTALGDAEPDLVRVIEPVAELSRIWRMLTTPELRRTPRVAAFFDFIVSEIDTLRPIITG